jgi:alkylation response protein AidB-like acyl-CoA dehydrogenase
MDLTLTPREEAFRDELRAWLEANRPAPTEGLGERESYEARLEWLGRLADGGWAAVHWPAAYGGRDASLVESALFYEELARARAPLPANALGLILAGPTILAWGSEEQKERYLPRILRGEEVWCQGFSEPEAGSDLAGVKTMARLEGDEWVVEGQKVWTSDAQYAKRCLLLVRTDPDAPKHRGLTYLILDMEQPGVRIVPLKQLTGGTEFNEVFLEGARVPAGDLLGAPGQGWRVAITTLMNERAGLGFYSLVKMGQRLDDLWVEADERGRLDDPTVARRLADLRVKVQVARLTAMRGLTTTERLGEPGPEGSLVKWMWSQTNQEISELALTVLGRDAVAAGSAASFEGLRSLGNSIEGGTTEILKNVVAERVLGLPKARQGRS